MRIGASWVHLREGGTCGHVACCDSSPHRHASEHVRTSGHLAGKVAVVTGASKGIGLAVTRSLAGEGASVVAGARDMTGERSQIADLSTVRPVGVDLSTVD